MSKQVMLVSAHGDETRIALTKDNILVGLHMEHTHGARTVGNIYKGTIVKVNPAFQAAFVDYGDTRNGFLSLSDVNLSLFLVRPGEVPITVKILGFLEFGFAPTLAAVSVITLLLPLALVLIVERISGLGDFIYGERERV